MKSRGPTPAHKRLRPQTGPGQLALVVDRTWSEVLPTLQPQAEIAGYGGRD